MGAFVGLAVRAVIVAIIVSSRRMQAKHQELLRALADASFPAAFYHLAHMAKHGQNLIRCEQRPR